MKILWFYNDSVESFIIEERKEDLEKIDQEISFIFI